MAAANAEGKTGSTAPAGVMKSGDPESPLKLGTRSTKMPWRFFNSTSSELPPGWKLYNDKTTNKVYYANKKTGESSWKRPKLSKQDKKELALKKQLAVEVKRCRSNSTKSSLTTVASIPSMDRKPDVESTQEQVHQVEKTVSFSLQDQVRTYQVEPREKNSPSKIRSKSRSPPNSKQPVKKLSSLVKPNRSQTKHPTTIRKNTTSKKEQDARVNSKSDFTKKLSYKPIKLGWKNNRRAEVSPPPHNTKSVLQKSPTTIAPSALLGIRGKSLKKTESQEFKVVESSKPDVATNMAKVTSLPASPSRKPDTEDSILETASTSPSKSESLLKKLSPSRKKVEPPPTSSPTGSSKSSPTRSTSSSSIEWETPVENSPDRSSTSSLNPDATIDSSASPQKPVSKIASLLTPLKTTPSKSQIQDRATTTKSTSRSKSIKLGHSLLSKKKILDPVITPPASKEDLGKSQASEVVVSNASPEDTEVSDMSEQFTLLLGCNDCNAHENDVSEISETKSPVASTVHTQPITGVDNGSPPSSRLSSFPLADMLFDAEPEADDSVKQETTPLVLDKIAPHTPEQETKSDSKSIVISRSPSKIVSAMTMFKKNRSRDDKEEELTEQAKVERLTKEPQNNTIVPVEATDAKSTPVEPVVVTPPEKIVCVDTPVQAETVKPKKADDNDTRSTSSSCSGIGADQLESRWADDNETLAFADENVEVQDSRCGDCGCSQTLHEQLLFVGGMIFNVVGKPNDDLRATMETAGDFFAEDEDSLFAEQDSDAVADEDSLHESLGSF